MMRKLVGLLAVAALAGCGGAQEPEVEAVQQLAAAADECGVTSLLGDGGASMSVTYTGKKPGGTIGQNQLGCLLRELEMPEHVMEHIDTTRALDGMREDEWGGIKARWTYHPDDGLRLTLVESGA